MGTLKRWELLEKLSAELDKAPELSVGDRAEISIRLKMTKTEILQEIHETGAIQNCIVQVRKKSEERQCSTVRVSPRKSCNE